MQPAAIVLPSLAASVAVGRRFVGAQLDRLGMDEQRRHDALLLTSELLTNSILHGHGEPRLEVSWLLPDVQIAVTDRGTWAPRRSPLDLGATSGRGLQLLERIADRYGTRESPAGTTIWFTLHVSGAELPSPRESAEAGQTVTEPPCSQGVASASSNQFMPSPR
jgi:anti-sigma regulatory factor (Ser/Thr protein kinase)